MSPRVKNLDRRIALLRYVTLGGFALAAGSQLKVQVLDADTIVAKAKESKRFVITRLEKAERGTIVSSDGQRLAEAVDGRKLVIQFSKVPKSRAFFMDLAAASGIAATEFALRSKSDKAVTWDKTFTSAQVAEIDKVRLKWRADGVGFSTPTTRRYELAESAAGVIGYFKGDQPAGGIELGQDAILKGRDGKTVGMVDREGQFLPMHVSKESEKRQNGLDIQLTLNTEIQNSAYESVKEAVIENGADRGVAIVMRKNGDILAMANYPSFDPSLPLPPTKEGETSADFTPSYQAILEPGSTFKILTVAKALDMGYVSRNSAINCSGQLEVGGRFVRCDAHNGNRAHGNLSTEEAIARSCNVSAANWALKIGYSDFVPFIEDLGLLKRPGLGLPKEAKGRFDYGEVAKRLQIANVSFGQSISVTPVALCSAFAMLANEGKAVSPRLVAKIGNDENPVAVGQQVIRPETAREVLSMMRAVVNSDHGTGKHLKVNGYDIGGKTGTAQKQNQATKTMTGGGYVSNFVGFVPAMDPEVVILVMVDNPKKGKYYGGSVAGPVFVDIAKESVKVLNIPPTTAKDDTKVTLPGKSPVKVKQADQIQLGSTDNENSKTDSKPKASSPQINLSDKIRVAAKAVAPFVSEEPKKAVVSEKKEASGSLLDLDRLAGTEKKAPAKVAAASAPSVKTSSESAARVKTTSQEAVKETIKKETPDKTKTVAKTTKQKEEKKEEKKEDKKVEVKKVDEKRPEKTATKPAAQSSEKVVDKKPTAKPSIKTSEKPAAKKTQPSNAEKQKEEKKTGDSGLKFLGSTLEKQSESRNKKEDTKKEVSRKKVQETEKKDKKVVTKKP